MVFSRFFSGKKILCTGASGFIGSALCEELNKNGAEVHGVYLHATMPHRRAGIRWWNCDLSDIEATRNLINDVRPDFIFHLASYVVGARTIEFVLPTFHSNLECAINIMIAATEVGCRRIIMTGSMEEPIAGDSAIIPSSPYAAAKWAASAYAKMFHELYGTPISIARVFMVYGPAQRDHNKLIPYTILSLLEGQSPDLTSGERHVDWIYVEDVVEGLLFMACTQGIEGDTIDLGSGETISIKDLVLKLSTLLEVNNILNFGGLPDRPMEQLRIANTEDTYNKIKWKPKTTLEEGLKKTIAWYREYKE